MENSNAGEIVLNNSNISVESVKSYLDRNDLEGAKKFLNQFLICYFIFHYNAMKIYNEKHSS